MRIVLIVPFMELKSSIIVSANVLLFGLNRTFYGIEISAAAARALLPRVLIVPFMELKYNILRLTQRSVRS